MKQFAHLSFAEYNLFTDIKEMHEQKGELDTLTKYIAQHTCALLRLMFEQAFQWCIYFNMVYEDIQHVSLFFTNIICIFTIYLFMSPPLET